MNDIRPPRPPQTIHVPAELPQTADVTPPVIESAPSLPPASLSPKKRPSWGRRILTSAIVAMVLATVVALGGWFWYKQQLMAVAPGSSEKVKVTIKAGTDPAGIAKLLKTNGLIRSETAFGWFVRLEGVAGSLQTGVYRLSKSDDVPTIVDHITSGKTDTFNITFLPGNTLAKHRQVLIDAGYDEKIVDAALTKRYNHPILAGKPASADLEGYIYGETYQFPADATPEQIIERTFDEGYKVITDNKLISAYKQRGLSLYQAVILASIIQREEKEVAAQKQVAQVFYLRMAKGMPLGSDPTYQYIADKTGQARDPGLDSPYNTRKVTGLPPGPISSPGEGALLATAFPAKGDYLYFLNGDDNKMYFGRTNEEHEKNIREHCQKKCLIL